MSSENFTATVIGTVLLVVAVSLIVMVIRLYDGWTDRDAVRARVCQGVSEPYRASCLIAAK